MVRCWRATRALNTVALTGESVPRGVHAGDSVISGCINLSGVLKVRVDKTFGDSTASKIIRLVEESGQNKSKSETFIRRFARVYTPIVVFLALAFAFIPPFFYDRYMDGLATWAYRALSLLGGEPVRVPWSSQCPWFSSEALAVRRARASSSRAATIWTR